MRLTSTDAPRNNDILMGNDAVKAGRKTATGLCIELDKRLFTRKVRRLLPAPARAAPLWVAAALLLPATSASEARGFPESWHAPADALANTQHPTAARNVDFGKMAGDHVFETAQASRFGGKPMRFAQATSADSEELQKALEQEHRRAELLSRQFTIVRRLEILLTTSLSRDASVRTSESEYAARQNILQQERDRLKQAAESGAAALCKSWQADRLEQDLAAAKRDVEMQTALAAKASTEFVERRKENAAVAPEVVNAGRIPRDKQPAAAAPVAAVTPVVAVPPLRKLGADELATLMRRGKATLATGDIPSARLLLARAAEAGEANAALMLAQTFDSGVLATRRRQTVQVGFELQQRRPLPSRERRL